MEPIRCDYCGERFFQFPAGIPQPYVDQSGIYHITYQCGKCRHTYARVKRYIDVVNFEVTGV